MDQRRLGRTGMMVSAIGFGAFKIGRNEGAKYPQAYALPDVDKVKRLLNGVLDVGINYIDTAPAYGLSEERIGRAIGHRRDEFVLSTKVGESFVEGRSTFDFTSKAVRLSVERSLRRLRTDVLDLVFVHSSGDDLQVMRGTDVVGELIDLRDRGLVRAIGFSGKSVEGSTAALDWADVLMVTYHQEDDSHAEVIGQAVRQGLGVVVKKGLASGHLFAGEAIRFVLANQGIGSVVVGGMNLDHVIENTTCCK